LKPAEQTAFKILRSWNYFNHADSEGASYYEAWWDMLMPMLWDEMKQDGILLERPTTYQTIKLIREKPDLEFFDIQKTNEKETAREVLRKSFSEAVESIEKWKKEHSETVAWADYKDSFIGHLLPPMQALSIPVKTGGNHDIVNAHSRTHGPSWRMVVSLEKDAVKAWATYPGGQSGNPGSKHYSNLLTRWVLGEYYPMNFLHKIENGDGFTTTTLNPESK
jgi:penicillin amidase